MTIKLTDLQLVLLSSAATRPGGNLLPPPASVGDQLTRIRKTLPVLLKRGLVEEADVLNPAQAWRHEEDRHIGALITEAGRTAIGAQLPVANDAPAGPDAPVVVESAAADQPSPAPQTTKTAQVLTLLRREQGATLAELVDATGWLPHTTRAALTGLRKKGHALAKSKRDEITCYRIAEAA